MTVLVSAGRLLGPDRVLAPGWVEVAGDRIAAVGEGLPPRPPDAAFPDALVSPGFVDIHGHGGGGASFTDGTASAAADVLAAHRVHGTTTMVASLVTESEAVLERSVRELAELVGDGFLAGIHLEGPWLSPTYKGAHNAALLRDPDPAMVERLLDAGAGAVRMVTLAPELPGASEAIRTLVDRGVVVAVGHTDATYATTRTALAAGAKVSTHLFNAMRPVHHREPGPVLAFLEDTTATIELIADGVHVHPAMVRAAALAKPGRFVLVTDSMAAAAAADGHYRLGPLDVVVHDGEARLADSGVIAGSTLTMAEAVRFCATVAKLPLEPVLRAATETPADLLGLADVGRLSPGRRADLVVLDKDLHVDRVMRAGHWLPRT